MIVYLCVIVFLVLFSLLFDWKGDSRIKNTCYYISMIFLICLAGFRGEIGLDTITYSDWYPTLPPLNEMTLAKFSQSRFEPLFKIVCSTCKLFSDEWLLPQFIFAVLINSSIFIFIKNHTQSLFSCILLFFLGSFYVLNCEEIRQAVSFSIVLFALSYLEKGRTMKYFLAVFIAAGFHYSSLIFFILPFVKKIVSKPFWVFVISCFLFIVAALVRDNLLNIIFYFSQSEYADYLTQYSDGFMGGVVSRTIFNYISIMMSLILIPVATYYLTVKDIKKNDTFLALFILYLFSAIINVQVVWFYRFVHIFQMAAIVVMANGWRVFLMRHKSLVKRIALLLMFTLYMYSLVNNSVFGYDETFEQYRYELFVPYTLYF